MAHESGLYLREKPRPSAITMEPISVHDATVITWDQTTEVSAFLTNANAPMGTQWVSGIVIEMASRIAGVAIQAIGWPRTINGRWIPIIAEPTPKKAMLQSGIEEVQFVLPRL